MVVLASSYPFTSFGVVCVDPSILGAGVAIWGNYDWLLMLREEMILLDSLISPTLQPKCVFLRRFQGIAMSWCFGVGDKFQR